MALKPPTPCWHYSCGDKSGASVTCRRLQCKLWLSLPSAQSCHFISTLLPTCRHSKSMDTLSWHWLSAWKSIGLIDFSPGLLLGFSRLLLWKPSFLPLTLSTDNKSSILIRLIFLLHPFLLPFPNIDRNKRNRMVGEEEKEKTPSVSPYKWSQVLEPRSSYMVTCELYWLCHCPPASPNVFGFY